MDLKHLFFVGSQKLRLMFVVLLLTFTLSFTQVAVIYAEENFIPCVDGIGSGEALLAALNTANTNGQADTINLGSGCVYELSETLVVKPDGGHAVTIQGKSAVISGGNQVRVVLVEPDATLTLNDTKIQDGKASNGHGGGIYSAGTLTLTHSTVSDNETTGHTIYNGGGIYNNGIMTLVESEVYGNEAMASGGGIFNFGTLTLMNSAISGNSANTAAGIYSRGTLTMTSSTLSYNTAHYEGGGVFNDGTLRITDSVISNNTAPGTNNNGYGGGILNNFGSLELINSMVFDNTAGRNGGGLYNAATATISESAFFENLAVDGAGIWNPGVTLTITNSTFFNNQATNDGGAIHNVSTLILGNSTLTGNSAAHSGGNLFNAQGSFSIGNSILAGSVNGGDCHNSGGAITVQGTNLVQDGSCNLIGSLSGSPMLGSVTGNPPYFPLQADSPAIDGGSNAFCPTHDQSGVTRPQDGDGDGTATCDIGAFEADSIPGIEPITLLVNGGFEAKTPTNTPKLAPWMLTKGTNDKIRCNTAAQTVAHEGLCAFMFKGGPSENVTLTQNVALAGKSFADGDKLRLSLRVKAPNAATKGRIKLLVKFNNPSAAPQQIVFPLNKTSGYVELTDEIMLQNGQVSQIRLQINHKSRSGKVYFDAVSLLQIKAPSTLMSSPLISLPQAPGQ